MRRFGIDAMRRSHQRGTRRSRRRDAPLRHDIMCPFCRPCCTQDRSHATLNLPCERRNVELHRNKGADLRAGIRARIYGQGYGVFLRRSGGTPGPTSSTTAACSRPSSLLRTKRGTWRTMCTGHVTHVPHTGRRDRALRLKWATSMPGLVHICAGTRPHLRRDSV
jgi:hypothetical protein